MPDSIMYSKGTFIRWIPFFMIFCIIPILIYLIIDSFNYKNGNFKILAFGSVLILGPIFGIWSSKLSSNDLKENGVVVDGVVIERWHSKNNWMIKAEFSYNGETYQTFSETDTNDKFRIGDNIKIEVSKRNPDNNNIIE